MVERAQARPDVVKWGVIALYIPLGLAFLGLLTNALGLGNLDTPPQLEWTLFFFVSLSVSLYVVWEAGRGKNWARIVVACLTLLTLASFETSMAYLSEFGSHPLLFLSNVATYVLEPLGTIALFLPQANAWYRKPVASAEAHSIDC